MEPYFSTPTGNFWEAFPEIASVTVEVTQYEDDIWKKVAREIRYTSDNPPPEALGCLNTSCRDGGLELGAILREMCLEKVGIKDVHRRCHGSETSGRSCIHGFDVSAQITFKDISENDE